MTSDRLSGKRLTILGLARQGIALARFAATVGAEVTVSDLRPAEQLPDGLAALADLKLRYVLGGHPLWLLEETDVLAISGSVPTDAPLVQEARARGIPVTNDSLEFARRCPATTLGITGSAGKTTTTTLAGLMCRHSPRTTWVGGNIGQPLIAYAAQIGAGDLVVQELSSFQLELWDRSPHIAAVLNLTPNHLDRHRTMAAYTAAKANILRYQSAGDVAILCADDAAALSLRPLARGRLRLFSQRQEVADGTFLRQEQLWLRRPDGEQAVCSLEEVHLRGRHNLWNVLAAIALADSAGVPVAAMRRAVAEFHGVAHRLESVRWLRGVHFVNDSIATAPERVLAALEAFDEPLVLLAGGRDKNMVWQEWAEQVRRRVKAVIVFGELSDMLEGLLREDAGTALANGNPPRRLQLVCHRHTLEEAVQCAAQVAAPGDVVLLSPGGTSYDAFTDFAERGEAFRRLVEALPA